MPVNSYPHQPDYTVPPGQTLLDTLEELSMSRKDLSSRTGIDEKTIDQLIDGLTPVTPHIANLLEKETGVPAHMWNNLEKNHQLQLSILLDECKKEKNLMDEKKDALFEAAKEVVDAYRFVSPGQELDILVDDLSSVIKERENAQKKFKDQIEDDSDCTVVNPGLSMSKDAPVPGVVKIVEEMFTYHPPTEEMIIKLKRIRERAKDFAYLLEELCPLCADRSAAIRKLRECVATADMAIVLNGLV